MYDIFTYINQKNQLNVGKYTIHRSQFGYDDNLDDHPTATTVTFPSLEVSRVRWSILVPRMCAHVDSLLIRNYRATWQQKWDCSQLG